MIKIRKLLKESPDHLSFFTGNGNEIIQLSWDNHGYAFWSLHPNGKWILETDYNGVHPEMLDYSNNFAEAMEFLEAYDEEAWEAFETIRLRDYPYDYGSFANHYDKDVWAALKKHVGVSGRVWRKIDAEIEGVISPNIVSFWRYPKNKGELQTLLREMGLKMEYTFIETDASSFGPKWLTPANKYTTPKKRYVPPVKHELPPHLR